MTSHKSSSLWSVWWRQWSEWDGTMVDEGVQSSIRERSQILAAINFQGKLDYNFLLCWCYLWWRRAQFPKYFINTILLLLQQILIPPLDFTNIKEATGIVTTSKRMEKQYSTAVVKSDSLREKVQVNNDLPTPKFSISFSDGLIVRNVGIQATRMKIMSVSLALTEHCWMPRSRPSMMWTTMQ